MCEMTKIPMVDTSDNDTTKRPFVKRTNRANIDKFRNENDKKIVSGRHARVLTSLGTNGEILSIFYHLLSCFRN
jgi:hypothetical protein